MVDQIHFTSGESERLRQISYEKQLQRGFPNPGSSDITSDLFSSEKWVAGRVHTAEQKLERSITLYKQSSLFNRIWFANSSYLVCSRH